MQRTTRPSGVPESPANSEKGCGGSRMGIEFDKPRQPLPNQPSAKPQAPVTHHAPGPLVHNLNQPKIQLPYKFLHGLIQATSLLDLTNPLGHSPDTFQSLQMRKERLRPFSCSRMGVTQIKEAAIPALRALTRLERSLGKPEGRDWECCSQGRERRVGVPIPV